jgi:arabinofuranosyltransferase
VLSLTAYLANKVDWLPLLCAMTVLARFEGGAMVAVICWRLWREKRFPRLAAYIPALLLVAFYLASNLHYYGVLLPHSAAAKFGQGRSGFWGRWPFAFTYIDQHVWLPIFGSRIVAPVLFFVVWFAAKDKRLGAANKIVTPFLLALGSF